MDLRKLKKLIDLVEESGIAEIEVTEGEEKVRITRATAAPAPVYAAPAQVAVPAPAPAAAPAAPVMAVAPAAEEGISAETIAVIAAAVAACGCSPAQIKAVRPAEQPSWSRYARVRGMR